MDVINKSNKCHYISHFLATVCNYLVMCKDTIPKQASTLILSPFPYSLFSLSLTLNS